MIDWICGSILLIIANLAIVGLTMPHMQRILDDVTKEIIRDAFKKRTAENKSESLVALAKMRLLTVGVLSILAMLLVLAGLRVTALGICSSAFMFWKIFNRIAYCADNIFPNK